MESRVWGVWWGNDVWHKSSCHDAVGCVSKALRSNLPLSGDGNDAIQDNSCATVCSLCVECTCTFTLCWLIFIQRAKSKSWVMTLVFWWRSIWNDVPHDEMTEKVQAPKSSAVQLESGLETFSMTLDLAWELVWLTMVFSSRLRFC